MKKVAQVSAVWPKVYQMLKAPPAGINLGNFPGKLPPINKITLEPGRLQDNPQAIGYVSSEDAAEGLIHLSVARLEEALRERGVPLEKIQNLESLDKTTLVNILSAFVEVIAHEAGHLEDYTTLPEGGAAEHQFFPGGEAVAEQAGRSALQQFSVATNTSSRFDKPGRMNMEKETLYILANLAEKLDEKGAIEASDIVEDLIRKYSQILGARELISDLAQELKAGKYGTLYEAVGLQVEREGNLTQAYKMLRGLASAIGQPEYLASVSAVKHALQREGIDLAPRMTTPEQAPAAAEKAFPTAPAAPVVDVKSEWLAAHVEELPGLFTLSETDPYYYRVFPDGRITAARKDSPSDASPTDITDRFTAEKWSDLQPYYHGGAAPGISRDLSFADDGEVVASTQGKLEKKAQDYQQIIWETPRTPFGR